MCSCALRASAAARGWCRRRSCRSFLSSRSTACRNLRSQRRWWRTFPPALRRAMCTRDGHIARDAQRRHLRARHHGRVRCGSARRNGAPAAPPQAARAGARAAAGQGHGRDARDGAHAARTAEAAAVLHERTGGSVVRAHDAGGIRPHGADASRASAGQKRGAAKGRLLRLSRAARPAARAAVSEREPVCGPAVRGGGRPGRRVDQNHALPARRQQPHRGGAGLCRRARQAGAVPARAACPL